MARNERDGVVLRHMATYCDEILETVARFGNSLEAFRADYVYRNTGNIYSRNRHSSWIIQFQAD